ncbi:hypothetical protein ACLBWP_13595 [Microbacterium sp. M1A1_1b]
MELHDDLVGSDRGAGGADAADPAERTEHRDAVGQALGVVLDELTPTERVAWVLHEVFAFDFTTIGTILDPRVGIWTVRSTGWLEKPCHFVTRGVSRPMTGQSSLTKPLPRSGVRLELLCSWGNSRRRLLSSPVRRIPRGRAHRGN